MLPPKDALARILAHIPGPGAIEEVPLAAAAGRSLARPTVSDVDLPPFEKSMMDGYALRAGDVPAGAGAGAETPLHLAGESRAGVPFAGPVPPGSCVEIYTGAALPPGCDAVVMQEDARREGGDVLVRGPVEPGQHVSHRAEILARGRAVHAPRRRLSAADIAVLAAIGCERVPCFVRPRVSVLTTGDELVPVRATPGPGQIREGNTYFLAAACAALGCEVIRAGIVPDEPRALEEAFRAALAAGDVLVTTGGVSVGKYDLVGAALEKIGVACLLHKVAVKPGKPIWFGMAGARPVFGLPGNPVSTLLGLEVFVRPALARLAGAGVEEERERLGRGRWCGPPTRSGDRQHNVPARRQEGEDGVALLLPVPWRGSADIVAVAEADALAVIEAGAEIRPGEIVCYRPLR
ncbi:MAG: gephyrin-like molybdotransferase Glp [Planctomycetota bacterium]